jgi:carotenoid cleavage dioxygenase-like enzyme
MPTRNEREYYAQGYRDGFRDARSGEFPTFAAEEVAMPRRYTETVGRKRKLSAWQKYIKNKRNHIKYRDGKLNLKKMGVAFRRKKRR